MSDDRSPPDELGYLVEPARRFGRYGQFECQAENFLRNHTPQEMEELVALAERVRVRNDYPSISEWLKSVGLQDNDDSAVIYSLIGLMDACDLSFENGSPTTRSSVEAGANAEHAVRPARRRKPIAPLKWDRLPADFHYLRPVVEMCMDSRIAIFDDQSKQHVPFIRRATKEQLDLLATAKQQMEWCGHRERISQWCDMAERGRPSEKALAWHVRGILFAVSHLDEPDEGAISDNDGGATGE